MTLQAFPEFFFDFSTTTLFLDHNQARNICRQINKRGPI